MKLLQSIFSSSLERAADFCSYSENALLSPHCSLAFLVYSSNLLVSNAVKSILLFPPFCIPRAKSIRLSRCSFFIVRSSICCSRAFFLSKSGRVTISLISFNGNSSSLNNKICCKRSIAASSYSRYPDSVYSAGFRSPIES